MDILKRKTFEGEKNKINPHICNAYLLKNLKDEFIRRCMKNLHLFKLSIRLIKSFFFRNLPNNLTQLIIKKEAASETTTSE